MAKLLPALLRGQKPEERLLLLLPLVPALLVFCYTRRQPHPAADAEQIPNERSS